MNDHSKAIDKLVFLACGEDEKLYQEVAQGMVAFNELHSQMKSLLMGDFKDKSYSEFIEWKKQQIETYKKIMNAYENLHYGP